MIERPRREGRHVWNHELPSMMAPTFWKKVDLCGKRGAGHPRRIENTIMTLVTERTRAKTRGLGGPGKRQQSGFQSLAQARPERFNSGPLECARFLVKNAFHFDHARGASVNHWR
jgi:hypothetical protein